MELSVIIPVFREAPLILETLGAFLSLEVSVPFEILVVDGEPEQTTLDVVQTLVSPPVRLIPSARGRGVQMNAGARAARGRLFLFLHADTRVSQDGLNQMLRSWQKSPSPLFCGAFDLAIASDRPGFRLIQRTASLRSRLSRIPYGDQGIFISRALFDRVGGYPEVPLMEDVGIMARIKALGIRPAFMDHKVLTSARRWEKKGVIRTTLINWMLITLYICKVPPQRLARFY